MDQEELEQEIIYFIRHIVSTGQDEIKFEFFDCIPSHAAPQTAQIVAPPIIVDGITTDKLQALLEQNDPAGLYRLTTCVAIEDILNSWKQNEFDIEYIGNYEELLSRENNE